MTFSIRALTAFLVGTTLMLLDSTAGAQEPTQRPQQVPATGVETPLTPAELFGIRNLDAMTNRSIEGLTFEYRGDGTVGLNLQGRFQNVMRAKTLPDGQFELSCVTEGHDHSAWSLPQWTPNRAKPVQRLNVISHLAAPIVVAPKKAPVQEEK